MYLMRAILCLVSVEGGRISILYRWDSGRGSFITLKIETGDQINGQNLIIVYVHEHEHPHQKLSPIS